MNTEKINKTDLAIRSGFSRQHISRVLNGDCQTRLDSANKIATVLGISIEELMKNITAGRYRHKSNGLSKELMNKVNEERGNGTTREIAEKYGISPQTVSKIWRKAGEKDETEQV